jgi:large subunit ribosomal protein L21e
LIFGSTIYTVFKLERSKSLSKEKLYKEFHFLLSKMVKRIGTSRRKTRQKFKKPRGEAGKISISKYLQNFEQGEKVCFKAEPAIQKGLYFPRFHGKNGVVKGMKGKCYQVKIKDGNKEKLIIVHPVHLKRL